MIGEDEGKNVNTPRHIAIIMDGNGRWAKKMGMPKIMGHQRGAEAAKSIIKSCIKFGIKYLTLYAFSTENWMRPKQEVRGLFKLLENFLDREFEFFKQHNVKLCVIGEREKIDKRLMQKIEKHEFLTKGNDAITVNVALSYGSRQEILNAVRLICEEAKGNRIQPSDIGEGLFSKYLYTAGQPDPDLLIRTSGEMRLSNFLLWQVSYAELYVTSKLWPDFKESDLRKAIEEYSQRDRRFGKC